MPRIPAAELEAAVVEQIRGILNAPPITQQVAAIADKNGTPIDEAQVTVALHQIDKVWEQLFPDEQSRIIKLLVEKIIVTPENIDIRLFNNGIEKLALEIHQSHQKAVV